MTLKNGDRFTVYDAMEAAGAFTRNPANANSRDDQGRNLYAGPVKFPQMLYHPQGKERVLTPGVTDPSSARINGVLEKFGEQWEIISREVKSQAELDEALGEGWHKHPAFAIKAANETWRRAEGLSPLPVPAISAQSRISDLEEENRRLGELLEEAKRNASDMGGFAPATGGTSLREQAGIV